MVQISILDGDYTVMHVNVAVTPCEILNLVTALVIRLVLNRTGDMKYG